MNSVRPAQALAFAPEGPRPLAVVRIGLGAVLLDYFAMRWPYAVELYSQAGQPMPLFPGTWWEPPVPSAGLAIASHSALLFVLLAVTVGWRTRMSLWMALVLSTWLGLLDAPGTFKKYSVIGLHFMLLLALSECGAIWSVDRFLSPGRGRFIRLGAAWPRRLMQVFVCSIYWGAAMTKLRLPDFATGDLLMFSLLDDQWGGSGWGLWLSTQPRLLTLLSMATVFFEIAFPLVVWTRLRPVMIAVAVVFHIGIGTALYLSIFSPIMIVALASFLTEADLHRMRCGAQSLLRSRPLAWPAPLWPRSVSWKARNGRLQRSKRRSDVRDLRWWESPELGDERIRDGQSDSDEVDAQDAFLSVPSGPSAVLRRRLLGSRHSLVLFVGTGCLATAVGVAVQVRSDRYGAFHPRATASAIELDAAAVERMLAAQLPAYEDYFHEIEIGSRVSSTHAFGERERFSSGTVVYVVARLIQNHPAMRLEGLLIAPGGQEVGRFEHDLESAHSHAINGFRLTEALPSGRYRIVLQADGCQVAQKSFHLENQPLRH